MTSNRTTSDTTRTIIRQQENQEHHNQQQNQQEQEREEQQYNSPIGHNNNYNNNTRGRAREAERARYAAKGHTVYEDEPREEDGLPGNEVMQRIASCYRENISPVITRVAAQIIESALKNDMEPRVIIMAIEETGMASRPSPYYLRAVLRNWATYGIVTRRNESGEGGTWGVTMARPWWR